MNSSAIIWIATFLCAATVCPAETPLYLELDNAPERAAVLDAKARKFGLNRNLLEAVVTIECAQLDGQLDAGGFDWLAENVALVLDHALSRASNLSLAIRYYATGLFYTNPSQTSAPATNQFVVQVKRLYRRLEKQNKPTRTGTLVPRRN